MEKIKQNWKKITWKSIKIAFGVVLGWVLFWMLYGTVSDWQPKPNQIDPVREEGNARQFLYDGKHQDSVVRVLIWNIGYCGMGAETDFFFDRGGMFTSKGAMVRPTKALHQKYLAGVKRVIAENQADFYLLQEVDRDSKRSYLSDQVAEIQSVLPNYSATFGLNYNVNYVPLPIFEPWNMYGKTYGGVATFSRFAPAEAERFQLPGDFGWPTRIFQLDRCLLVTRYMLKTNRFLTIVNLHNSAHDKDGAVKKQEMEALREYVRKEVGKGSFVIVGGDWNQCPPNFEFDKFGKQNAAGHSQINIAPDFFWKDNWRFAYDSTQSTNRKARNKYEKGKTFETLIDFFLYQSSKIQLRSVRTIDAGYAFSDHQPVIAEFVLKY